MTMIRFGPTITDDVWGQCAGAGVRKNGVNQILCKAGRDPNTLKNALLLVDSASSGVPSLSSAMVLLSPSLPASTVSQFIIAIVKKQVAVGFRLADASFRSKVFVVGNDFTADEIIDLITQNMDVVQVDPPTAAQLEIELEVLPDPV